MDNRIKSILYQQCLDHVILRMRTAKTAMEAAQEAANAEQKSSAGDKFETTRAMMQAERDKNAKQLQAAVALRNVLEQIQINKVYSTVQAGSLVETSLGTFFIAISLGKTKIEDQTYYVISAQSPVGRQLIGLEVGQETSFNGRIFKIKHIS